MTAKPTGMLFSLLLFTVVGCAVLRGSAPTATGSINGWIWHDLCDSGQDGEPPLASAPDGCIEDPSPIGPYRADGLQDPQEPPIGGVLVRLGKGACPAVGLAEATTVATDLSYSFVGLEAGTYCVSIGPAEAPNMDLLRPGIWTFPQVMQDTVGASVTVAEGQNVFDVNFGWDHQFLP